MDMIVFKGFFRFLLTTNLVKNNHIRLELCLSFQKLSSMKIEILLIPNFDVSEKTGKAVIK